MKTVREILEQQIHQANKRDSLTRQNAFIVWLIDEIYEALEDHTEQEETNGIKDIYKEATESETLLGMIYYRQQEDLFHRYQKDILHLAELFHEGSEFEYHLAFANKTARELQGLFYASSIQALTTLAWFFAFLHITRIISREQGENPLD